MISSKTIGDIVHQLRTRQGLSTTQLALKVEVSQAQVSRLENGQQGFRSDVIVRFAKALKVPPFRLFMTDEEWGIWETAKK